MDQFHHVSAAFLELEKGLVSSTEVLESLSGHIKKYYVVFLTYIKGIKKLLKI